MTSFEQACDLLREGATVADLRERCGISRRTAYRYLDRIRRSGVILTETRPPEGPRVYRLDPSEAA